MTGGSILWTAKAKVEVVMVPGGACLAKANSHRNWSDEKAIKAVKEVANDPTSERVPSYRGRTEVHGTRNGVDINVTVGVDRKTVINAYPQTFRETLTNRHRRCSTTKRHGKASRFFMPPSNL